jgi:hypothetical protein
MPVYNPRTGEYEPDPVSDAALGSTDIAGPHVNTVIDRLNTLIDDTRAGNATAAELVAALTPEKSAKAKTPTLLHRSI